MSSKTRIESVKASKFRGASRTTTLTFDPSKQFVLLFGENGTGKSSMIDAIDMVCNQHCGTLSDRSSVTMTKHLPTIGAKASDLYAEVAAGGNTWRAALKGIKIWVSPNDPPAVAILRRHKVLKLVEATPSERFAELKRFIDVERVQASEDALPKAIRDIQGTIELRTAELELAQANLKRAFDEDHLPEESGLTPIQWAEKRTATVFSALQATVTQLKAVIDAHAAAAVLLETKNASQNDIDEKRLVEKTVKEKIDSAKLDMQAAIVMVDLLGKATDLLEKQPNTAECPVCGHTVDGPRLAQAIRERLAQLGDVKLLADEWAAATAAVRTATATTGKSYANFASKVADCATKANNLPVDQKGSWIADASVFPNLFAAQRTLSKDVISEADQCWERLQPLMLDLGTRHESLNKHAIQLGSIKRDHDTYVKAQRELEEAFAVKSLLDHMLKVVRSERIAFTQEILDGIADECDVLYSQIHPGEKLGGVRFALDQEKKGSLLQSGQFEGFEAVAPQAYFSDSHLDTLAFCFFLAVTKRTARRDTAVIIDDVFSSVDLNHIKRILITLLSEAKNFNQVIMATHQRRWLDLFLTHQAPIKDACIVQLRDWSIDTGICGDEVKPYLDELRKSLVAAPFNRREIGSLSGFLIESALGETTKQLGCSIKRNPRDKYTASDLLNSMAKPSKTVKVEKTDEATGVATIVSDGPPSLNDLITSLVTTLTDVRNTVGDHFNWDAAEITNAMVKEFGEKALAMCQMLLCDHCGGMAMRDKETFIQCGCGRLRIYKS